MADTITVLIPTGAPQTGSVPTAPRPKSLQGLRVALLDNGKKNVKPFLDHVGALLRERYAVREVTRLRKTNQNAPARPDVIAALARADAAVSAVGD